MSGPFASITASLGTAASRLGELLGSHAPSAVVAIIIAELFYKFHSFTLECLAFLATWYVIDTITQGPYKELRRRIWGRDTAATR
jgi:hypothetical protein